jgi:hypothetical protein
MKTFASAFGATVDNYVDPVDATKLIDAAIAGMDDAAEAAEPRDTPALVEAGITATTRLYDRRGYNPEKSASFFATY